MGAQVQQDPSGSAHNPPDGDDDPGAVGTLQMYPSIAATTKAAAAAAVVAGQRRRLFLDARPRRPVVGIVNDPRCCRRLYNNKSRRCALAIADTKDTGVVVPATRRMEEEVLLLPRGGPQKRSSSSSPPSPSSSSSSNNNNNNPDALNEAQDDSEMFEVMEAPPPDGAFDVYRDRPTPTGETKARRLVYKDGDWHRSVHVWIVDPVEKEVVVQKRSPRKDTFPNRWDISAAGHIGINDKNSKTTALRELAEELGIRLPAEQLAFAFTCPAEQAPAGGWNCYEDVYFVTTLRKKESQPMAIGRAEVADVKWIPVEDLERALRTGDESFVPRVEQYRAAFFAKLSAITECSDHRK